MKKNEGTHGSKQHPAKGQSKAVKDLVKHEAKIEAKKEVEKIVHKEKMAHKKGPRSQRGTMLARGAGVHTAVLGTGVETLRGLAGVSPKRRLSGDGRECSYSSVDWVGSVTIPAVNAVGDLLFSIPLAPSLVPVTRLAVESTQWEKYMVESWEFLFVTTQGTTTSGQLIAFVDPDPRDTWVNDPYNVSRAASQFGSMPINVWENFGTRLPITRDTKVTTFYTNPTTTSDVRFTQPGVLRVINAGGWATLPSSGVTMYNVYQRVTLRFMDPELSVSSTTPLRAAGTVSDSTAKVTSIGTPLLTAASTISTGVPLTIAADGTMNIDTSSVGDNNVVIEFEAEVSNGSSVEHTIAIDPQAPTVLDQSISSVRAVYKADATLSGQLLALAQVLLDGTKSWSIQAVLLGVATVIVRQATARVWIVPRSTTTLIAASKLTGIKLGRQTPPRPKLAIYSAPSWYTSASSFGLTKVGSFNISPGQSSGVIQQIASSLTDYFSSGLDMYVYYDATNNRISYQWNPADASEVYYIQFYLSTSQSYGTVAIGSGQAFTAEVNGVFSASINTQIANGLNTESTCVGTFTPTATNTGCYMWAQDVVCGSTGGATVPYTVAYTFSIRVTQALEVAETSWVPAVYHEKFSMIKEAHDLSEKEEEQALRSKRLSVPRF